MSILKFKNPETGEWEKVGIPNQEVTPESIGAATVAQVQAAQDTADNAVQAAQTAQSAASTAQQAANNAASAASTADTNATNALNAVNGVPGYHVWEKWDGTPAHVTEKTNQNWVASDYYSTYTVLYSDGYTVGSDGSIALNNPVSVQFAANSSGATMAQNTLRGKYCKTTTEASYRVYFIPSTATFSYMGSGVRTQTATLIDGVAGAVNAVVGYVWDASETAYPKDDWISDYCYKYTKTLAAATSGGARVEFGSYKGTEKYGSLNPSSLTFSFAPKFAWIYAAKNASYIQPINNYGSNDTSMGFFVMEQITTSYASTYGLAPYAEGGHNQAYGKKSEDGKTLYWYNDVSARKQLNDGAWTYYYMAIG